VVAAYVELRARPDELFVQTVKRMPRHDGILIDLIEEISFHDPVQ
jgi:hypothetical protein